MAERTKRKILIVGIIVVLAPSFSLMQFPNELNLRSLSVYISATLGYAGMVVLLWSYILGAKSVISIVFRDIAPVLKIHKWIGKYGTIAIFLHPLLIAYGYGESLFYSLTLDTTSRFESHVTLGRLSLLVVAFIWVTSALLRSRIKFRPWRYIHLLGYIALPFAFLHVPDVGSQFMSNIAVKAYYFSLLVMFSVFVLLRLRGMFNLDKSAYTIVANKKIVSDNPSIWLMQLRPRVEHIRPEKGQYVYLKDGLISEEHPFSVLDFDEETGDITIAYRTFGRFTKELSKREKGAKILLAGPYGEFTHEIQNEVSPIVFVAGGIGVTPMIRHIIDTEDEREKWLFYANRTKQSAMIIPELRHILGRRLVAVYSRQADNLEYTDEYGHIDADMFKKHLVNPSKYSFYLCGSDTMMDNIQKQLTKLGVAKNAIHREAFGW